jgi:hypothetical protein
MRLLEVPMMILGGLLQGLRMDLNLLEILAICGGFWAWRKGWRPGPKTWFNWLPNPSKPWVWALGMAAGVVALRLALVPVLPAPEPLVADEFSHLLLADTLLHGRLANATHPFWQHFESLHIVQQPHYVSNYFPGPAAVLAVARIATGNPWAGVLAECAVFLAALYWALRGWMPSRWSLYGTLLAALRFGIGSYWVNAFHGGFLPAIGGALVFGAFGRIRTRATRVQGAVFGIGLAVMALTRPFEGVFFALPIVGVLLWEHRKSFSGLVKIVLPAAAFSAVAVVLLGGYFKQVTGSPFVTTYQISQKTYGWPMGLAWTPPPKVEHTNLELARYYKYELSERGTVDGPIDFLEYLTFRVQEYWRFFFGPILTIPLLFLARVWKRQRMLFLALSGALFAVMLEGAASPHYIAVATVVIVAILVECVRHMRASRVLLTGVLPVAMLGVLALRIGAQNLHVPYSQQVNFQSWCCRVEGNLNKARIRHTLEQTPGNHLVFVKTKTSASNLFQWIYNDAEIDASRIVWARDLGEGRNAQLAGYYKHSRDVWLVDPNVEPATLTRYPLDMISATDPN